jgi:translation elongation factor EF-Ts
MKAVTAEMVKELRERTGVGMARCKGFRCFSRRHG